MMSNMGKICGFVSLLILGCGQSGPVPIHYGADQCENCKMNIIDNRFGSETITATNKVYKFDSIECMAAFNAKMTQSSEQVASLWVTNFYKPESFIALPSAQIVRTKGLRSPMGLGFAAFSSESDAERFRKEYGGEILNWSEVTKVVSDSWSSGH
jgi:copper chaperone NosL